MNDPLKNLIGLAYPENALKKDLWDVIKKSRTPPVYAIDKIADEKGDTVYWEIFEVQNFRGLIILKFFANKFSRMAIKARGGHVHEFKFSRFQEKSAKTYESEFEHSL